MPRPVPDDVAELIELSCGKLMERMLADGRDDDEIEDAVLELELQVKKAYFAQCNAPRQMRRGVRA